MVRLTGAPANTLADLADAVGGFDCVHPVSEEYLHVAVKPLGFVVDDPDGGDELDPDTADAAADAAADVFADERPFEAELERVNLFPDSVFAEIDADGRFERIHRELLSLPDVPALPNDGDAYTPHVTLGDFRSTSDFEYFVEWLEDNRDIDADPIEIDAFHLVERDPAKSFSSLETLRTYELEE
ncbi:hypothetical protein GCM10009039_32730 [Halocalculus aciditolerans]|uniref:2'-5' RNA ligase family protein n=1 Tax=Halocalculus aciditolerans TaxID=1383812 RepID=A0A830FQU2_9EURY|nr:hypothetical protein GCM10009039_32730 [Halocalculus aciditolerans]